MTITTTKPGARLAELNQPFSEAEYQDWRDKRAEWVNQLTTARGLNVEQIEKLNGQILKLNKKRDSLRDELASVERELSQVRTESGGLSRRRDYEISKYEGLLRESANDRHRQLCEAVEREIEELQGTQPISVSSEMYVSGWRSRQDENCDRISAIIASIRIG